MSLVIEELASQHDRKSFDCGVSKLDLFLREQARQKTIKNISKTYVACCEDQPKTIVGYHSLTGYSVLTPPNHKNYKKYPHPLNAVKLARLAVSRLYQGQKIGEKLLIDAIYRTVLVAQQIASIGLFVDPMTPDMIPFYQQYGFLLVMKDHPLNNEMWLPITTCQELSCHLC